MDDKDLVDGTPEAGAGEDRWRSDSSTVERRDRDMPPSGAIPGKGAGGTGPIEEEQQNQASLPERGETKE